MRRSDAIKYRKETLESPVVRYHQKSNQLANAEVKYFIVKNKQWLERDSKQPPLDYEPSVITTSREVTRNSLLGATPSTEGAIGKLEIYG